MSVLRLVLVIVAALVAQVGLGHLWPGLHRVAELLLVPVVLAAVIGSQRAGLLTGCAAGLLHDAWFEGAAFGIGGFRWTFLGWALGAVNARVDLNNPTARWISGVALALANAFLDPLLRRLLDQPVLVSRPLDLVVQAILTGLLAAVTGSIVERKGGPSSTRRFV